VNTQHGRGCGGGWKGLWQFRLANRLTDRVVGVSEDATKLCQSQDRWSAGRMQCIWNGIDVDRFRYAGPSSQPVAISVGRLSPEKDFPTLLRAARIVSGQHPRFRLKIVGDGAERPRLEQLARELDLQGHVEFLGERKDIPDLLRTAGFYVSSSKTEGISLTLLEAMAVGLPIVATRVGGNPEIVVEGLTGKLAPPLNPDALAAAMHVMLSDRDRWPAMGQAARARIEESFNVRHMVSRYEALYRDCLASRGR
jgi:glycosyltransferase involved in cell wall biosynthesis